MADNGTKEKLIGSDGKLVTVEFGDALSGTDDTIGEDGWYIIDSIGDPSDLPSGANEGELVYLEDGDSLADGDEVRPLNETEQADVTEFNIEIERAEVDVTTLSDDVRRYRAGKVDMNGSLEGITTLGETDREGWIMNNFIKTVDQEGTSVTSTDVADDPIYMKGYIQKDDRSGQKEAFVWARVNLLSTSLGASGEDAQSFSSSFRIAPGDPDPTLYIRTVQESS